MTDEELPETYNELLLLTQPRVIHCLDEYHRQVQWVDRIMKVDESLPNCEPRIRIAELLSSNALHWELHYSVTAISGRDMLVHTMAGREISKSELAEGIGVSCQLISAIIRRERAISPEMASKFAKFFDHPIECYVDPPPSSSSVHTPEDDAEHAGSTRPLDR